MYFMYILHSDPNEKMHTQIRTFKFRNKAQQFPVNSSRELNC